MTAVTIPPPAVERDFDSLLDAVDAYLRHYLRLSSDGDYTIITLWVAHTYVMSVFDTTPYLGFTTPNKRYGHGKTTALNVLETIVCNPWRATLPTAATLYRVIEERSPTMLIDELDATRDGDQEAAQAIRAVLNTGYQRNGTVPRIRKTKDGHETLVDHKTFCAKAYAIVGNPWDSLAPRTILINMPWASRHDLNEFRWSTAQPVGERLRAGLSRWACDDDVLNALADLSWNILPVEVEEGRVAQLWKPLVGIADLADGDWGERVRAAIMDRHGADSEIRETQQIDHVIDAAIRDALDRGFVRVSSPADSKSPPPVLGEMRDVASWGWPGQMAFKTITVWHDFDACSAELRVSAKDWDRFWGKVRDAVSHDRRLGLPFTGDEALKVLKTIGRLHTETKRYSSKVAVYTGGNQDRVIRLDISHWCWPNNTKPNTEEPF